MEELKSQLLKVIEENKKEAYDIKSLALILNMTSTSSFVKLNKALNELIDEYLIVLTQKNTYIAASQAKITKGIISINTRGAGFVDVSEDESIHFNQDVINGALNKDEVLYRYDNNGEGIVLKILNHSKEYIVGTFNANSKGTLFFDADDAKVVNRFKILNLKDYKIIEGLKARVKIVKYGEMIQARIVEIIGHKDDPGVDISAVLLNFDIVSKFPDEVNDELKKIKDYVEEKDYANRIDLRNEFTCTIDGDDSKDFDDAVSIERKENLYNLKVSIADVSYYVKDNTPLDNEASKRGTSTYVCDRVVPMLPHYLSNGICSLNPHVDRLTITCDMDIDNNGKVVNYSIYPSVINSNERMTYKDVNLILENDEMICNKYNDIKDKFLLMHELSLIIRHNREQNGAIDFEKEESKIIVDKKGRVVDIVLRERKESERIIEDFMVLANETVAKHTKWLEIPTLYRIHEQPKLKKLETFARFASVLGYKFKGSLATIRSNELQKCLDYFKDENEYPIVSTLMLRSMAKAKYDPKCLGHYGLGLEEYCHFTSPIRRYPDLIMHRALRKYCFDKCIDPEVIKNDELLMEELALSTSDAERRSTEAERSVDDMKKAEFMQSHIGEVFDGVISSVVNFGFFVELPNTIEGLVHIRDMSDDYYKFNQSDLSLVGERTNNVYKLGQIVKVKCVRASKEEKSVDFILVKEKKIKQRRWI